MSKKNILFLFDIDGTIIKSDGAGSTAVKKAFKEYFGKIPHMEGFFFDGKTDPLIFNELAQRAGIHPIVFKDNREVFETLVYEHMSITVKEHDIRLINRLDEIIPELNSHSNIYLGLVTGNDIRGANLKLNAVGAGNWFRVGAYGSDDPDRNQLPKLAVLRAERLFNKKFQKCNVWVIGDTPSDILSGKTNGYSTLAVATGRYSVAELLAKGADIAVESLDPQLFKEIILKDG